MGLETGARVGPYRITGVLGAGGMGEVYRAHDSSLGRDVALKVLPPDVASDKERLARFAREARVLASLDHPNIGTIHGWEDSTGLQAIVLELVEGPTLRERMASGPMRLDDALGIARQIADALESAHEQGIVHRDLKPANIKIRPDGRVKVLDFGLAKALEGDEGRPNDSATTVAATRSGVALGTPAYMSPEQARGEAVNRRTDIWSFGVVLFEMLAGRHPFGSGPPTEVMAAILRATPEWEALPAGTPPQVTRLLRRCLEKDPRSRIHDIGDARLELEDAIAGRSSSPSGSTYAASSGGIARGWSRGAQIGAAAGGLIVVGAAITGAYVLGARRAAPLSAPAAEMRFQVMAPADAYFQNAPAVSPDGRSIAFVAATENGQNQLWVKALSATTATVLPGTKGAIFPFWSPDSASIGFFAEGQLKRVSARGDRPPSKVCDASLGRGGAWFDDGTIVFAPDGFAPLLRVPASGGTPIGLTELNKAQGELSHRFPARVSGKYLLFYVTENDREAAGARLISLDDPSHQIKSYPGIDEAEYADGFLFTVK
ncbi:MAG TPA: protein kinase, partial [Vicinamibacterales bacterium]|nr:protein kinase [Vicinamibacterales bacterium]